MLAPVVNLSFKAVSRTNQRAVCRMFNNFICFWPNMAVKRDAPTIGGLENLCLNLNRFPHSSVGIATNDALASRNAGALFDEFSPTKGWNYKTKTGM